MTGDKFAYLDSSAIIKLIVREAGSDELREFLRAWPARASSAIAQVEVLRFVERDPRHPAAAATVELVALDLIPVDASCLAEAGRLPPALLRSLDAIHLAAALSIQDSLGPFITYDLQLAEAARFHGLEVAAPGTS